eukprot:535823-Rhodomonas_salina.2
MAKSTTQRHIFCPTLDFAGHLKLVLVQPVPVLVVPAPHSTLSPPRPLHRRFRSCTRTQNARNLVSGTDSVDPPPPPAHTQTHTPPCIPPPSLNEQNKEKKKKKNITTRRVILAHFSTRSLISCTGIARSSTPPIIATATTIPNLSTEEFVATAKRDTRGRCDVSTGHLVAKA